MAEGAFTARASTRAQVYESISKLSFTKSDNGQYTHDDAAIFIAGMETCLATTYNLLNLLDGMSQLIVKDSDMAKIKSTDGATSKTVLAESKLEAAAASIGQTTPVPPSSLIGAKHKKKQTG